jgi:hypothetical protein
MTLVATLAEFKTHLNRADATDDTELTFFLTAASQWTEYAIGGPLDVQTFTEIHWVEGGEIVPRKRPLATVTSITPDQGTALGSSSYFANTGTGMIEFRYGAACGWYTVVYTAGLSTISERIKLGGLEVARHLWLVQNGSGGRGFPGDELIPTPMGFSVPRRAMELIAAGDQIPGIG